MSQPVPYNRLHDFTQYATDNPGATYNPAQHDAELNAIETTLDGTLANLAQIQRDDGKIANAAVHQDALSTATLALIASNWTPRGAWITGRAYVVGDLVENTELAYVCASAHTSGTFSTDRAADRWVIVGGSVITSTAADVPFTPAGDILSTDVQAALQELDADLTAHMVDSSAAHAASAISYAGSTNLTATTVEAALDELDTEKAPTTNAAFSGTFSVAFSGDAIAGLNASGFSSSASGSSQGGFLTYQYSAGNATGFVQYRARGSFASVADSQAGDVLNNFAAFGWNASTWRSAGAVRVDQESYTAASGYVVGTLRFFNTNYSGVDQENLRIWGSGAIATAGETPAAPYANRGDLFLPAARAVRAKNAAKFWVSFQGNLGVGPCTIYDSFNVASVEKTATGDYTITFANAMPDANFSVSANGCGTNAVHPAFVCLRGNGSGFSTTSIRIHSYIWSAPDVVQADMRNCYVQGFGS